MKQIPTLFLFLAAIATSTAQTRPLAEAGSVVAELQAGSRALLPIVKSALARRFLVAAKTLPPVTPRNLYRDESANYLSQNEVGFLPEEKPASSKVDC